MKPGTLVILELLKEAVEFYNRPVCYDDLFDFSKKSLKFPNFGLRRIKDDIRRLIIAGEIVKAGNNTENNKGSDFGRFLYLPATTAISEMEFRQMASPVQIVEAAFNDLWSERLLKANTERVLPQPLLTNDIYKYLAARNYKFDDKRTLPNTLIHLSQKTAALIRKVERPNEYFTAWASVNISDDELSLGSLYGSDSERIATAVQRACLKYGRAVTNTEINEEITDDQELRLSGKASLSIQLNDSAKEKSYVKGNLINRHQQAFVRKAGQFNGTVYYYYGKHKDGGKYSPYVTFLNLRHRWEQTDAEKNLEEIEGCRLPTVAAGRALLIVANAGKILSELKEVLNSNTLIVETKCEAEFLQQNICTVITLAEEWIKSKNIETLNLPSEVDASTQGLIAQELLRLIKPFYPKAREIEDPNRLITLLHSDIRRIPNPNFKHRFSSNFKEACSFLFDKTDALLFIALNWGGYECGLQASLAAAELGNLRDVRFVIPALESANLDERLSAIACLAFLQNEEGNKYLQHYMVKDTDPNIRQAAIWAYAFTKQPNAKSVLEQMGKNDLNNNVRLLAQSISGIEYEDLWQI